MKPNHKKQIVRISSTALAVAAAGAIGIAGFNQFNREEKAEILSKNEAESPLLAASTGLEAADSETALKTAAVTSAEKLENPARNAAERLAGSLSPVQKDRLLGLLNGGGPRELLRIHGVGETRAEAIQAARPFESVAQLAAVHGVGKVTYASIIEYAKQLGEREAVVAVTAPSAR